MKLASFLTEEKSPMSEQLFIRLLDRFTSTSGSVEMGDHDEWFQKNAPGVEPWKWAKATAAIAKFKRKK